MNDFFNDDNWPISNRNQKENPLVVVPNSASPEPASASNTSIEKDLEKLGKMSPKKFEACLEAYKNCSEIQGKFYNERFAIAHQTLQSISNSQTQIEIAQINSNSQVQVSENELEAKRVEAQKEVDLAQKDLDKFKMDHEGRMKILNDYKKSFEEKIDLIKVAANELQKSLDLIRKDIEKDKKGKNREFNFKCMLELHNGLLLLTKELKDYELYKQTVPSLPESK